VLLLTKPVYRNQGVKNKNPSLSNSTITNICNVFTNNKLFPNFLVCIFVSKFNIKLGFYVKNQLPMIIVLDLTQNTK